MDVNGIRAEIRDLVAPLPVDDRYELIEEIQAMIDDDEMGDPSPEFLAALATIEHEFGAEARRMKPVSSAESP